MVPKETIRGHHELITVNRSSHFIPVVIADISQLDKFTYIGHFSKYTIE